MQLRLSIDILYQCNSSINLILRMQVKKISELGIISNYLL